ncbi:MAG: magnesium transporter CorA family protein [Elusimicrobia bacterium]|nr:magnesium transporter CorA family protein [Elusimicrobiota bacterium]
MLKGFELVDGKIVPTDRKPAPILVFVAPDEAERMRLQTEFRVDEHTLASALDPDEPSRLELSESGSVLIINIPRNFMGKGQLLFKVASAGLFLYPDRLLVVISEDIPIFSGRHFQAVKGLSDLFLKVVASSIHHFLEHLKVINMITDEIEAKIAASMENKHLLNLFSLEKSLVYYLNALSSNGLVFEKMRSQAARLGLGPGGGDLLDDIIIENSQCLRQAEIQSNILASLMDARASIVGNNLNRLMKELNAIVVAVMVPGFFASVGGMSEWTMMTKEMDWRLSYAFFLAIMFALGALTYIGVRKLERR